MPIAAALFISCVIALVSFSFRRADPPKKTIPYVPPKGCVFRTVMGEESSVNHFVYKTPEQVQKSVDHGLGWIVQAQHSDGGWGAGMHRRQDITNPHAVETDPATTAMVAMAILRSGNTLTSGKYSSNLRKALYHLMEAVEEFEAVPGVGLGLRRGAERRGQPIGAVDQSLQHLELTRSAGGLGRHENKRRTSARRCQADGCRAKVRRAHPNRSPLSTEAV